MEKKVKKKLGFLQKCQQKQMVSRNWKKTRNLVGVKRFLVPTCKDWILSDFFFNFFRFLAVHESFYFFQDWFW